MRMEQYNLLLMEEILELESQTQHENLILWVMLESEMDFMM